jgi:hypothetical protein
VPIVYYLAPRLDATHIYDHIETFPTHICHLRLGRTPDEMVTYTPSSTIMEDSVAAEEKRGELLGIALKWLREDREIRKQRDKERGRERGAKSGADVSKTTEAYVRKGFRAILMHYRLLVTTRPGTQRRFMKSTITTRVRIRISCARKSNKRTYRESRSRTLQIDVQ